MNRVRLIAAIFLLVPESLVFTLSPLLSQNLPGPPAHGAALGANGAALTRNGRDALPKKNTTEAELRALLDEQAEAWNRGDIAGFLRGYWKSDRTTFSSSSGVFRGWDTLLDRYRRKYPDRAAMGLLEFSDLEIMPLSRDAALILGHWQLDRQKDRPGGVFTLIARRFPEGWRIIHDHTSSVSTAAANQ